MSAYYFGMIPKLFQALADRNGVEAEVLKVKTGSFLRPVYKFKKKSERARFLKMLLISKVVQEVVMRGDLLLEFDWVEGYDDLTRHACDTDLAFQEMIDE